MSFNYYKDLPQFVSNSDLGRLRELLYGIPKHEGLQKIFDFGNLVDARITEPFRFDAVRSILKDDGGRIMTFTPEEIRKSDLMVQAANSDKLLRSLLDRAMFQHVVLRKAEPIEYNGECVFLPMRMKADAIIKNEMVIDIKTTGCKDQKSFNQSIYFFDYDRQAAIYMDLCKLNRALYAGIGKERDRATGKHPIFKFIIERGDEVYQSGLKKKNFLGYKYHNMIHTPNFKPLRIAV